MQKIFAAILMVLALAPQSATAQSTAPGFRKLPAISMNEGRWNFVSVDKKRTRVLVGRGEIEPRDR